MDNMTLYKELKRFIDILDNSDKYINTVVPMGTGGVVFRKNFLCCALLSPLVLVRGGLFLGFFYPPTSLSKTWGAPPPLPTHAPHI